MAATEPARPVQRIRLRSTARHGSHKRRTWLIPTYVLAIVAIVAMTAVSALLGLAPSARAGDIYAPYQGTWYASSQGVKVGFTENVATITWVPAAKACPMSARITFRAPGPRVHAMRGRVTSASPCIKTGHELYIGQPVVVIGNPRTHHFQLAPAQRERLWLCRSKRDPWCFDRG